MLSGVAQLHQQRRFGRQSVRNAERAERCLIDTHLLSRLKHQLVGNSVEKCWEKWQGSGELYIRSQTMQNVMCLHVGEGVLYTFLSFVSSKDDAASTWVTLEKKQILESVARGLGSDLLNQTNPPPSFLLPWHLTLPRRGPLSSQPLILPCFLSLELSRPQEAGGLRRALSGELVDVGSRSCLLPSGCLGLGQVALPP